MGVFIPIALFYTIYKIVLVITSARLQTRRLNILKSGEVDVKTLNELPNTFTNLSDTCSDLKTGSTERWSSLKWAFVAIFSGFGFFIIEKMYAQNGEPLQYYSIRNAIGPLGLELCMIGLGFLTYFVVVYFLQKREK
ncbi:hypothetical protein K4L44_17175 [Halosquirtibacter laminarini]|uniref:Uncharacterized protein n=1 Tax=Halosquirtibacter laminarini TaxID=3374600 RepID=A0AC61NIY2_9BACT|nr:hypothetical protein K4L44_17175 [Prolixibacteraceae bacterium]